MLIQRATRDLKFKKYCNDESYLRNLSYVCLDDRMEVIAFSDFKILNQNEACLINCHLLNNIETIDNMINLFINEFSYWNPFIKIVNYKGKQFHIQNSVEIFQAPLLEIRVEQLSVSKSKLENVLKWMETESDVIVCVIKIDNELVCIDGYSRLLAAYLKGFSNVYYYFEKDEYDENDFREFLKWCQNENIYNVVDLEKRIVGDDEHNRIWINRCQNYFKSKNQFN